MKKNNTLAKKFYELVFRMPKKTLNILTISVDIIMAIIFILTLVLKENFTYGLYWAFINLYIVVDLFNIMHWDYDGLKADKKKSDNIVSNYRDITTITIVLSGLLYLAVLFFDSIKFDVKYNTVIIVILFVLLSISQLFNHVSIYNAKKESAKLAESISGKKKK